MPYNQHTKNFIKTIPRLTPSVWKEDKIHQAKWPNQTNWCAECYSKNKTKQIQNDKFWAVFFSSVMCTPPFFLERWDMDSKVVTSYLDCDAQCRRCLHLLFVWGWFSTVLLWEVIDPVGQHTGDKQSSPAFPTILFSDFRLVPFSSLWLFLSVYSWLYNKYAVKGFPVGTQILVDIVMFEDTFFIPYWKIQKCILTAKGSWCTAVEILKKIQVFLVKY